jgi:hypothetical protein
MIWLDTRSEEEAARRREAMWGTVITEEETEEGLAIVGRVRGDGLYEAGRFWADAINDLKDDPEQRLAMAKRHLPLPAAFLEAAIALRALIREARKSGQPIEERLKELHHLAAISSLGAYDDLDARPYSQIEALDLSPRALGWEELPLLNKTDQKWMAEVWGQANLPTTARKLYPTFFGPNSVSERMEQQQLLAKANPKPRMDDRGAGRTYTLGLAGESFGERQSEIRRCHEGDIVRLIREPSNPYDANAIRCESRRGISIGMISRENASWLASKMDRGDAVVAVIREVCSRPGKPHRGIVIDCHINGGDRPSPEPARRNIFARLLGL